MSRVKAKQDTTKLADYPEDFIKCIADFDKKTRSIVRENGSDD
jgi:hypothetical protein